MITSILNYGEVYIFYYYEVCPYQIYAIYIADLTAVHADSIWKVTDVSMMSHDMETLSAMWSFDLFYVMSLNKVCSQVVQWSFEYCKPTPIQKWLPET